MSGEYYVRQGWDGNWLAFVDRGTRVVPVGELSGYYFKYFAIRACKRAYLIDQMIVNHKHNRLSLGHNPYDKRGWKQHDQDRDEYDEGEGA